MNGVAINMISVSNTRSAPAGTANIPTAPASALPAASPPQPDALECLYAVLAKDRETGVREAGERLKFGQKVRRDAIQRQKEAVEKAMRAQKKGGFWKKLAKTCTHVARAATVVASVAVAVGSAGAATPVAILAIAGASISAASFAQGELHVLQKLGVDDSWADKIGTGLSVASVVCMIGTLGVGALASDAVEEGSKTVDVVSRAATGVGGASEAVGGVATIETGKFEAEAQEATSDAVQAKLDNKAVDRQILAVLDALEESERSDARAEGVVRATMETKATTLVSASGRA